MRFFTLVAAMAGLGFGQDRYFAGGAVGVTTVSADGKSMIGAGGSSVSAYKPENGAAWRVFGGRHFTEYLSGEVNYTWTQNSVALSAVETREGRESAYDETRRVRQQAVGVDAMLYFRGLRSRFRPYLTAGPGWTRVAADAAEVRTRRGTLPAVAERFASGSEIGRAHV